MEQAIRNLRKKVWEEVPNRDHDMVKVFSHGNHDDDTELMTLGTATWTYHEGHQNVGDWAAHVKLEKDEDGKIECSYYQIIMVSRGFLLHERGVWEADVANQCRITPSMTGNRSIPTNWRRRRRRSNRWVY